MFRRESRCSSKTVTAVKLFAPGKCSRKSEGGKTLYTTVGITFCQGRGGEYTEIWKMGMGRFLQTAVSAVLFALLMRLRRDRESRQQKREKENPSGKT
jgi:hypothetical protein